MSTKIPTGNGFLMLTSVDGVPDYVKGSSILSIREIKAGETYVYCGQTSLTVKESASDILMAIGVSYSQARVR